MECKNCKSQFEVNSRFCARCGNRIVVKRLTVKSVLLDFSNQVFNYDNKIFKTFIHLLTKPEVVINKFVEGSRKTYVNVVSYLALSISLIGFQILILRKFYPETMANSSTSSGLDPELEKRVAEIGQYILDYIGLITIMFIPILALATYVIFRNKGYNYAEHIVLNMYASAQYTIMMFFISLVLMLAGLSANVTLSIVTVVTYIYLGYCLKRVFKLTVIGAIWRTMVSQMLYMMIVGVISIVLAIIGAIIYKLITG